MRLFHHTQVMVLAVTAANRLVENVIRRRQGFLFKILAYKLVVLNTTETLSGNNDRSVGVALLQVSGTDWGIDAFDLATGQPASGGMPQQNVIDIAIRAFRGNGTQGDHLEDTDEPANWIDTSRHDLVVPELFIHVAAQTQTVTSAGISARVHVTAEVLPASSNRILAVNKLWGQDIKD